MNVDMSIMALENIDKTESAQKVRTQMASLYKRATNKVLPLDVTDIWVDELVVHAAERLPKIGLGIRGRSVHHGSCGLKT